MFGSGAFAGSSSAISQRSAAIKGCQIAFVGSGTAIGRGCITILFGSASFAGTCLAILPSPSPVTSCLSPRHLRPTQGIRCDPVADRHRKPVASLITVIGHLVPLVGGLITLIGRLITLPSGVITQIRGCVSPVTSPIPLVTALIPTGPHLITPIRSRVALSTRLVPVCAGHVPLRGSMVTLIIARLPLAIGGVSRLHSRALARRSTVNLAHSTPMKERQTRCELHAVCGVSTRADLTAP